MPDELDVRDDRVEAQEDVGEEEEVSFIHRRRCLLALFDLAQGACDGFTERACSDE